MVDFEIAGVTVTAKLIKNASKANLAVHSKTEQNGMDEASHSKIYEQATARMKSGFFKPLPPTMTDPKQLSQYKNIDTVITNMGEHFQTYDMDDVWNIVFPTEVAANSGLKIDMAGKAITKNLFTEYANIDIKDVAASNEWYHLYTDNDADNRSSQMHTNLLWTYQFLKNNVEPVMVTRLIQKHDKFPDMQQGGTILFALLMRELLFTTEAAVKNLAEQMKN
jgi:hypothetical protein